MNEGKNGRKSCSECQAHVLADDMQDHLTTFCVEASVECYLGCGMHIKRKHIRRHVMDCARFIVKNYDLFETQEYIFSRFDSDTKHLRHTERIMIQYFHKRILNAVGRDFPRIHMLHSIILAAVLPERLGEMPRTVMRTYQQTSCPLCQSLIKFGCLSDHAITLCPKFYVECPLECGKQIRRCEMWTHMKTECRNYSISKRQQGAAQSSADAEYDTKSQMLKVLPRPTSKDLRQNKNRRISAFMQQIGGNTLPNKKDLVETDDELRADND